jgi:hypothetical protein
MIDLSYLAHGFLWRSPDLSSIHSLVSLDHASPLVAGRLLEPRPGQARKRLHQMAARGVLRSIRRVTSIFVAFEAFPLQVGEGPPPRGRENRGAAASAPARAIHVTASTSIRALGGGKVVRRRTQQGASGASAAPRARARSQDGDRERRGQCGDELRRATPENAAKSVNPAAGGTGDTMPAGNRPATQDAASRARGRY